MILTQTYCGPGLPGDGAGVTGEVPSPEPVPSVGAGAFGWVPVAASGCDGAGASLGTPGSVVAGCAGAPSVDGAAFPTAGVASEVPAPGAEFSAGAGVFPFGASEADGVVVVVPSGGDTAVLPSVDAGFAGGATVASVAAAAAVCSAASDS